LRRTRVFNDVAAQLRLKPEIGPVAYSLDQVLNTFNDELIWWLSKTNTPVKRFDTRIAQWVSCFGGHTQDG